MKTTLILETTEPEETDGIKSALNADGWRYVVEETLRHIRSRIKHGDLTEEADKEPEELRRHVLDEMSGHGLTLD
jgi:hypothetical protein